MIYAIVGLSIAVAILIICLICQANNIDGWRRAYERKDEDNIRIDRARTDTCHERDKERERANELQKRLDQALVVLGKGK